MKQPLRLMQRHRSANETAVTETEEPPLDGEFGTSTESADAQVSDETVSSDVHESMRLPSDVHELRH